MLFGFGAIAAIGADPRSYDLLSTVIALFGATLITMAGPLTSVRAGASAPADASAVALPLAAHLVFAVAAMMTKREVVYTYEDLAPHVKRIVERERVKAEIDAANRIQAALLPVDAPRRRRRVGRVALSRRDGDRRRLLRLPAACRSARSASRSATSPATA